MKEFWNSRYAAAEYAYGKEPNEFFKLCIDDLKPGKLLLIGEGEGRNAVYAAQKGWDVDAVDFSTEAQKKALLLSAEHGARINYIIEDLTLFEPEIVHYDAVGIIFVHFDENCRIKVHNRLISSLKTDGHLILEIFEKDQIKHNSGGPKNPEQLYSLEDITTDFIDLDFITFSKETIYLKEGACHQGDAEVIRFLGKK